MPYPQTAQVAVAAFGAPVVAAPVVSFSAASGGNVIMTFSNPVDDASLVVSVQVSADNATFVATSANNNLVAITSEVILPRTSRTFTINLRGNKDSFFRVVASGGVRGELHWRGDAAGIQQFIV